MPTFEFTFVIDGLDPEDPGFEDALFDAGCDDATIAMQHGALTLSFAREATSYLDAVLSAYQSLNAAGAKPVRFEPDFLVTASDIAARASMSKAAISLYERGHRGQGFPKPVARITTASPLWDWFEVAYWLHKTSKIGFEELQAAMISRSVCSSASRNLSFEQTLQSVKSDLASLP
jgi:transcriptional regulator with XRE-family HTH domain